MSGVRLAPGASLPRLPGSLRSVVRSIAATTLAVGIVVVEASVRTDGRIREQVLAQLVAFALFVPAAWLCWRGLGAGRVGVILVLVLAVAMRAVAFDPEAPPPLTTDTYRYAWDARVQAAAINPYRYSPFAPELVQLRDDRIWPRINRKTSATIYPPGAEAGFLAARSLFGTGVRATTWLFLLAEAGAIGLLILTLARTGVPLERVAVLAWHPLAISEIAANGHSDALAVLAAAALLAAWACGRRGLAGAAVGAAALFKLGPILLVPALVRGGGRRFVIGVLAILTLGYSAYASAGTKVVGSLFTYLDEEDLGSLAWWTLNPYLGRVGARTVLLAILFAVVVVVSLRHHDTVAQVARSSLLVLGSLLLTLSLIQPWSALWLLPFLVVVWAPGWLWLSGTLPLLYVFGIDERLPGWVRVGIYGPFIALAALRMLRGRTCTGS